MTTRLSRREMLKIAGMFAAGSVLAACGAPATTEAPTKAPEAAATPVPEATKAPEATPVPVEPTATPAPVKVEGHVVVMHFPHEFTEDQVKAFNDANPGITAEVIQADQTALFAQLAAGTPPDLYRCQAPSIPPFMARKLLFDMTPYFQTSQLIKVDDLAPANKYYWAKSPLEIGDGNIYGMCKDWSPDFSIFINTNLFENAKLPIPDDTKAMTYDEVMVAAKAITKKEGQRIATWGYGYESGWVDRIWMNMLAETGKNLYKNSFSQVDLVGNEEATKIVKWFFDMASEDLVANPINPSPNGWFGTDFTADILAMCQYGYWFSAMAETDKNKGKVMMLPGPTWAGQRRDPTMTATGMVMISKTKVPDAAWKVFEYYNAGQPSIDRSKSGWGVPALISQYPNMPKDTPYQQQVQKVLAEELAVSGATLQFNPFLGETAFPSAFSKYLDQAVRKQITFEEMLQKMQDDVNVQIQEGIDRLG